jgi:hypothetical protein
MWDRKVNVRGTALSAAYAGGIRDGFGYPWCFFMLILSSQRCDAEGESGKLVSPVASLIGSSVRPGGDNSLEHLL